VTGGKGVAVEPSFDAAVVEQLRARGHEVSVEAGHGVFALAAPNWCCAMASTTSGSIRARTGAVGY
jgi:hypothetical protein